METMTAINVAVHMPQQTKKEWGLWRLNEIKVTDMYNFMKSKAVCAENALQSTTHNLATKIHQNCNLRLWNTRPGQETGKSQEQKSETRHWHLINKCE